MIKKYILIALICALPALAQNTEERVKKLEKTVEMLLKENQKQKEEIEKLKSSNNPGEDPELKKALDNLKDEKSLDRKTFETKELSRLIKISANIMGTVGSSTAENETLETLQGGGHDPKERGFNLQQAELGLSAEVDPYFKAEILIAYLNDAVELERETA